MHYLGIVLAALAMFALGSVWYSPVLFMKAWLRDTGQDPNQKPDGKQMARTFGLTLVLLLISAAVLDCFISNWSAGEGLLHGLWVGVMGGIIAATVTGINYLFERKSWTLFFINAGYDLVGFCIMGMILSLL
jgi:hypothetical protein